MDDFSPFGMSNAQYSSCPITIVVSPAMNVHEQENLFSSIAIQRPKSPGKNQDVYLHPLVDELKLLWDGV